VDWYLAVLRKYATFDGRARRMEYWMFVLFNMLIGFAITLVDVFARLGFLGVLYSLAMIIPTLAVTVRRLHDTGRSGWWVFINLIPVVGAIVLFIFMVIEGDPHDNEYGPDPEVYGASL